MLPEFPEFTQPSLPELLELSDEIHTYDARSDFTPAFLRSWYTDLVFSDLNGNVVARYFDPEVEAVAFTLVGGKQLEASLQAIFAHQSSLSRPQVVSHIDERQLDLLGEASGFTIEPDPGALEYILSTKAHIDLTDPKLKHEARRVRKVLGNTDVGVFEVDLSSATEIARLLGDWQSWDRHHKNNNNDLEGKERKQIARYFEIAPQLPTRCLAMSHTDHVIGFTVFDVYPHLSTAVGHFLKVDYSYDHATDYLIHALCKTLLDEGIERINIENDLGIPGIRKKKESLLPVDYVRWVCPQFS